MKDDVEIETQAAELIEFGTATEETRGGFAGYAWDGGLGKRWL